MVQREDNSLQTMDIQVMLTPEQVATEILQAVTDDRRDLTLAPNPDIAFMLQVYKDDPDKAEMLAGESHYKRTTRSAEQRSAQGSQQ